MSERLFRCRTCLDVEWVAVDAERDVVKPCPACNQSLYARWSTGELGPDFHLRRLREEPNPVLAADGLADCRATLKGLRPTAKGQAG